MAKISRITAYPFAIPLRHPFRIATMVSTHALGVFVRLETSDGIVGWGEAAPLHAINGETQATVVASLQFLAPLWIGRQTDDFESPARDALRTLPGQNAAISALEMALWDAHAQSQNLSLKDALGGQGRPNHCESDITIGIASLEVTRKQTEEILNQKVKHLKVKTGNGPQDDYDRVKAVREVTGQEITIRTDANQGYDYLQALLSLQLLHHLKVEFCEQPVPRHDLDGLKQLHQLSPVPVMADESIFGPEDAHHLVEHSVCFLFNLKLSKTGGISRAKQIADLADSNLVNCMMGGMVETRLGVTAAAHLALAHPAFEFFDLDAHHPQAEDPILGGITLVDGETHLPEGPGLGAQPDPNYLKSLTELPLA